MGFRDAIRAADIGLSAEDRMKHGHRVFAYRLQLPQTPSNDMSDLADAIERVEALGWVLDRLEPDAFVGKSAVGVNLSWLLVFRATR